MEAAHLEIASPGGSQQLPLGGAPVTIGRHPDNTLVIADHMASRHHCVIEPAPDGGWQVRDLRSSNGTRVNGQVIQSVRLGPGDAVTIGRTRVTLVTPELIDSPDLAALEQIVEQQPEPVELLTEDDIVGDSPTVDEEAPVRIGAENDNFIAVLVSMAESIPDKPFDDSAIGLAGVSGKMMHPPGRVRRADSSEAVDVLRLILLVAFRSRATDIHVEPKADYVQVRARVDGSMVEVVRLPASVGQRIGALVKVLSDIELSTRNMVQEGRFTAHLPTRQVDFRVSFAPSVFGQKLVLRVLDAANAPMHLRDLRLPDWMQDELSHSIQQDSGMILVCGPTGSGKTSSLYALLRSIDVSDRNVVTIEDPVEIQIDGVTQMPVDDEQGKSFSDLLRSVLRQDPDVILVGEIRDAETARIAMQAAITGHLVFSTIHTKDTIGTIFRLIDLGIEPYMVSQGLQVVLGQRLVRQLCPYCKKPVTPTPVQIKRIGREVSRIFMPHGCPKCLGTGYAGRQAIFELLHSNDALRDVIVKNPGIQEVRKSLGDTHFQSLAQVGFELVAEGVVSYDEIVRAVGR